jgi:hypothetical protein
MSDEREDWESVGGEWGEAGKMWKEVYDLHLAELVRPIQRPTLSQYRSQGSSSVGDGGSDSSHLTLLSVGSEREESEDEKSKEKLANTTPSFPSLSLHDFHQLEIENYENLQSVLSLISHRATQFGLASTGQADVQDCHPLALLLMDALEHLLAVFQSTGEGERERGREGERERGREGEKERGREGEKERRREGEGEGEEGEGKDKN